MKTNKDELAKEILDIIGEGIEKLGSPEPIDRKWFDKATDRLEVIQKELFYKFN